MGSGDLSLFRFVLRFVAVVVACFSAFAFSPAAAGCGYPALFSFGTSLSDTGNGVRSSLLFAYVVRLPYGETYFGRPVGRFCDGRVMIDFLAQSIGLPFLNPYLEYRTAGTDFSQGVNYAVAGATVQGVGFLVLQGDVTFLTTDSLDVQLNWHLAIQKAAKADPLSPSPYPGVTLPSPSAIANGLYYFEFGGNDYGTYYLSKYLLRPGEKGMDIDNSYAISTLVPTVIGKLMNAIEVLYANEARNFILFTLLPEGCAPVFLKTLNGTKDALGCLSAFNEVNVAHNQQLEAGAAGLRSKYPDINIMIADDSSSYEKIRENPGPYGFTDPINACCGAGPGVPYQFALTKTCLPNAYVCPNPSNFLSWDGIHNSEALNRVLINSIVSGEFLNPSNGLACASSV